MVSRPLSIGKALEGLAATPLRLAELTAGVPAAKLRQPPAPGEWSVVEVLAHLRSCADVWGGHIAAMLEEDKPQRRAINPRTWILQTDYPTLTFAASFRAFRAQRAGLLKVLRALPEPAWSRTCTLVGAGKTLMPDVRSYASHMFIHERPHLTQVATTVAALR